MATRPKKEPALTLTKEDVEPIVQMVEHHLRLGARPPGRVGFGVSAIEAAAKEAIENGWAKSRDFVRHRVTAAEKLGCGPDWTLYVPPQYQPPHEVAQKLPVFETGTYARPDGNRTTICVIPDTHDDPRIIDKSRFLWLGRWVAENRPDYVVQLGDFMTLDSLSTHHDRGSLTARLTPSFGNDIESAYEALHTFEKGLQGCRVQKIITKGNHEFRADRFEDCNPQLAGGIVSQLNLCFAENGWRTAPYGEFVFIEDVGFIHHVNNGSGKAYGGKTGVQRATNDSTFSFVHGHLHTRQKVDNPKIGPNQSVTGISAGCALPYGHVEHYAKHATTGWWFGALKLTVQSGIILDEHWVSMLSLEALYGD